MGCCGESPDHPKGIVTRRSCTDVICLFLFGMFWAGMGLVAYEGIRAGEPNRILYGIDSYGMFCGNKNTLEDGTEVDLTEAKKLYYLNPLQLLDPMNYQYADTVCLDACPSANRTCAPDSFPCTSEEQFVCPYYHFSQFAADGDDDLGVNATKGRFATDWWDDLTSTAETDCADADFLAAIPDEIKDAMMPDDTCGQYHQLTSLYPDFGPCHAVYFETDEFLQRCYPIIPEEFYSGIYAAGAAGASQVASDEIEKVVDRIYALADSGFNTYVTDAQRGFMVVMLAGPVLALILCLVYMILIRLFAGVLAWCVVCLINLLLVATTVICAHKGGLLGQMPGAIGSEINEQLTTSTGDPLTGDQQHVVAIVCYIMAAVTVIVFILTLLMIRRIKIAIAVLKVAAKAVGTMPSIMLFPLVTFVSFIGLFVYWVIVFAFLWSVGETQETYREQSSDEYYTFASLFSAGANGTEPDSSAMAAAPASNSTQLPCYEDPDCYYSVTFNSTQQYLFAYHIFGLLWTNQFIIGFGYVVIAGAIAQYYWNRGVSADMPKYPVLLAMKNASLYHLGSIAFGAFIVAVIQFVRLILEYVDRKTKKMQAGNPAAKWVMCCLRYCLWYLEKIMKFINRNAYIMVAVKSMSYCSAAMRAVKLIINNAARLAAVNVIGDFLLFLGKLTVVISCGAVAFYVCDLEMYTDPASDSYLNSPMVPVALSMLGAYVVAKIFFAVYEMAIDTILLSFCEDCQCNNEVPQYAPKLLMSALGKAKRYEEQQAEKHAPKGAGDSQGKIAPLD